MELQNRFCPQCGEKIKVDSQKEFNFCSNCGYKIYTRNMNHIQEQKEVLDIEEKLEEVNFYYRLSVQKKEAIYKLENPEFYLKGQDLLVDLSSSVPSDYRIWFELSKPLDYSYEFEVNDINKVYHFNKEYFNKALALANIEEKKALIMQYDQYEEKKANIKRIYEEISKEEQKKKEEIEREEKRKQEEKKLEEQRKYELEEERRKREKERIQKQVEISNRQIFEQLGKKNYDILDNMYFTIKSTEGEKYIGVFKEVSKLLYLMVFHIDEDRNVIYREQSMVVKTDEQGVIIKYDNNIVKIRNDISSSEMLHISSDGKNGIKINEWELCKDESFIVGIMKNAKKPLFSLTRVLF